MGEFKWLLSLSTAEIQKFKQIALEIHLPFTKDKWVALQRLTETHHLVHLHANNFFVLEPGRMFRKCVETSSGQHVPFVFEATYVRKTELGDVSKSREAIPGPLDQ